MIGRDLKIGLKVPLISRGADQFAALLFFGTRWDLGHAGDVVAQEKIVRICASVSGSACRSRITYRIIDPLGCRSTAECKHTNQDQEKAPYFFKSDSRYGN